MRFLMVSILTLGLFYANTLHATNATRVCLRDKIAQMLIIGFEEKEITKDSDIMHLIHQESIGGVILYQYNIESPEQVKHLNTRLQSLTHTANQSLGRPDLPLLISIDHEGGVVNRLTEALGFPATISAEKAAEKTHEAVEAIAEQMAVTLENAGFNLNFSPLLDVNTNSDNPIIAKKERSFSDNPKNVSAYAAIYSEKFLNHGVQCAYKHFPGHGSSTGDSHEGFVDVSKTWQSTELYPYQDLFNQPRHCGMVMTAHTVNRQLDESGLPATLSHKILTDVLRNQVNFNGVIVTDDMQMKAISEHYTLDKALTLAINAGADMVIFGNILTNTAQAPQEIINMIEAKVKSGEIKPERIDDAYQHIVTFKRSLEMKS
jgi:beta-N-acetylhexosaminidase